MLYHYTSFDALKISFDMLNPRSKCASGLQGMTVLQIPMNLSWG